MISCDTIDSILDDGRAGRLDAAERQASAAHLRVCARCADASAAHEALAAESMGAPPPARWARVLRRVGDGREVRAAAPRRKWRTAAGLAAAAAAAVVAARLLLMAPGTGGADAEATVAAEPAFAPGRGYVELAVPRFAADAADKIAVEEFFMFLCFPCFAVEDELARFGSEAEEYVTLTRVPVAFYPPADLHARAYYTAAALGKLDEMHRAFYEEIHTRGNRLESIDALAKFFARFGVDAATFAAVFNSTEVDARVGRAAASSAEYDIGAAPSVVVAGRYATNPSIAGPEMVEVVKQLVADEAERAAQRWLERASGATPADANPDELLRPVDRVAAYSRLLEAADDPAAPPFIELALERARAGLSADEIVEAERRHGARRAAR